MNDSETQLMPRMWPVSFNGCFGWLHAQPDNMIAGTAVVLCPGLATDGLNAHRSFRLLANALATSGYPTLRFNYPGTGDSCDPEIAEHWSVFQQSINNAADWLRGYTRARHIVLCGLRIGATLAAIVAESRKDVAGLVLLAPVLRGHSYIRQLSIEASGSPGQTSIVNTLVVQELKFSRRTVDLIDQVDLRKVIPPRGCRVAIYNRTKPTILCELVETWNNRGIITTHDHLAELDYMLRSNLMSHEPAANVAPITTWLRAAVPAEPVPSQKGGAPDIRELHPTGCIETPLRFGEESTLFGILCRPEGRNESDLAVVIGNSSGNPHYGFTRAAVDFARQLAGEGIASLRMDFAGLGDSLAPGDVATHVLETDRRPDIRAAIDALEERKYKRFAIQGLCSGAYHAFQAALVDPRINVLLLINLQMFQWRAGDPIDFMRYAMHGPLHFLRKLSHKGPWMQLLKGQLNGRQKLAMQGIWLARKVEVMTQRLAVHLGFRSRLSLTTRSVSHLSQQIRVLFLFSKGDEGIKTLAEAFGPGWPPSGATVRVISGLDHSLTTSGMREVVNNHLIEFLDQYLRPVALLPLVERQPEHGVRGSIGDLPPRSGSAVVSPQHVIIAPVHDN